MDEGVNPSPPKSYSKIFEEQCPFYMSIGMSFEEYWNGDNSLPMFYRKAYKIKQEQINHDAWLHGLYVYDALCSAMSHLSSKQSSHKSYAEKPYSFDTKKNEEMRQIEAQAQAEVWLKSWVSATQEAFRE